MQQADMELTDNPLDNHPFRKKMQHAITGSYYDKKRDPMDSSELLWKMQHAITGNYRNKIRLKRALSKDLINPAAVLREVISQLAEEPSIKANSKFFGGAIKSNTFLKKYSNQKFKGS